MIEARSLISTASLLLGRNSTGAPNQTRLRRAVSTAYYALFHGIIRSAADSFVGAKHRKQPRYETIYRAFDHGQMRSLCEALDKPTLGAKAKKAMASTSVSQELRDVASAFVSLQQRRHWADYSPTGKITRSEAGDLVEQAQFAIDQLTAADKDERRNFLAFLMMDVRI